MYKFIQKNQKKMLAIFAVGLMIVFILPYGLGQQGSQGEDSVVAHLGDEPLYASEFERARMEWEVLERLPTRIPIALALLSEKIGPQAAEAVYVSVKENEGHYLLLQKEATRAGLRTTDEEVDIYYDQISRVLGEGAARQREPLRAAIRGLLLVRHGMSRVADNVKVSRPMVDHHLASLAQRITLRVVEFNADQFAAAMPAPPDSVLREQFQRWREVPAGVATSDNPFGFGYRLPNRVKLQYVTIPRDLIEQAVRGQQDEFKWEVLARRYYNEHHDEFVRMPPEESPPTTQSTTAPATGPSTQPVATAAPTTGPSTQAVATTEPADTQPSLRPFAEVREDALEQVLRPRVDELMAEVTG